MGWPEYVGIPAAVLVLLSYLFSNQVKLRIVNLGASLVFVAYGLSLAAFTDWEGGWSTVVLNALCAAVHIVYLVKHFRKNKATSIEDSEKSNTTPLNKDE